MDKKITDKKYKGDLTKSLRDKIIARYGKKGVNALIAVDNKRVLKYLDFFVVIGNSGEYVIADDFCTCHDFSYRQNKCWHILAVKIAEYTGVYTEMPEWYQDRWAK
ncbi:SWIM zinc finger family protein [Methanomicrobium antiquum]|uniref:SWIM zinc finger family protein n=1 Tax=Methanomicrobium antiquum TaxID=487686 RepID=A0AAF0JNP3_9EURY|nr:SWIM zinc finger family protein [Methanomicrobium antiquum]MDD3976980.1 SWIM zinc finger family protein [Methanomicrobium sp.]WFN37810.1 SWIM zinc finger family protein [Methanomicrobium antiquum]